MKALVKDVEKPQGRDTYTDLSSKAESIIEVPETKWMQIACMFNSRTIQRCWREGSPQVVERVEFEDKGARMSAAAPRIDARSSEYFDPEREGFGVD